MHASHRLARALLVLSLTVVACASRDDDSDSTSTEATGATEPTESPTSGPDSGMAGSCECPESEACATRLCPEVDLRDGVLDVDDEAALTCALAALRDDEVGTISWHESHDGGEYDEYGALALFGGRVARIEESGCTDECCFTTPAVGQIEIDSAEFFAACLEEPGVEPRFACLRGAAVKALAVCAGGECE